MSTIGDFIKKAHDAISNFAGNSNFLYGKDGDVVFSKNNVCVHDVGASDEIDNIIHIPGYLTIHCQHDDQTGATLILQWLPNSTLQKNPASIRSVSPRSHTHSASKQPVAISNAKNQNISSAPSDIGIKIDCNVSAPTAIRQPPSQFVESRRDHSNSDDDEISMPAVNLTPNTQVNRQTLADDSTEIPSHESPSKSSSPSTSRADEISEDEENAETSSCYSNERSEEESNASSEKLVNFLPDYRRVLIDSTPEQFAIEHNLMLNETDKSEPSVAAATRKVTNSNSNRLSNASLFSVNLGKMKSMRLFYSNPECTSGQLVIASSNSHYKILHFHHGGLDKLAQIFDQWSAVKAKNVKDGHTLPRGKHLLICQPAVGINELDPEDGLYDMVTSDYWKSYKNSDGVVDDSATIRKVIFFASIEPSLRKEIWPFLLRVYPWQSTLEQRESIRNDLFLEYQNLRKKRHKNSVSSTKRNWGSIESAILKDVLRTDRKNPYYSGEDNPNIETMKNILLNYVTANPYVNYIQGMSDLLSPLLSTIRNEVDTYWCFVGLMQRTVFSSSQKGNEGLMEINLEYLRELLKLLQPDFFNHLVAQKGDALQLMFVHRWILLFFKREFPESDALHIWEACWAQYRTSFFHLFVCCAIVAIYGADVIAQNLAHDEILLYFSSLAMHMNGGLVLKKARGLLHEFSRRERIPCSLAELYSAELEQWDSHRSTQQFECTRHHGEHPCPFAA